MATMIVMLVVSPVAPSTKLAAISSRISGLRKCSR
jgi:hypothetical protein